MLREEIREERAMESTEVIATSEKRNRMWLLKLGAAIFLIAIGIWWAVRMNTVMWNAAASDPNALQAKAGETTKVVVEITEATSGGEIRGKILKEKTKEVYTRTGEQISARSNAETKYVMGNAADVRAGAIVHVTGTMQRDRSIVAQQIVILTGYVKVE
jgi:ABC-type nickel/cobalt efflux system permease component RcnA